MLNLRTGPTLFRGLGVYRGDQPNTRFDNNLGYARIKTVTAQIIVFDDVTFTPVTEAGAGKKHSVFPWDDHSQTKRNPPTSSKCVRISLSERSAKVKTAFAEYLEGAVANEFSLELLAEEKDCRRSYLLPAAARSGTRQCRRLD